MLKALGGSWTEQSRERKERSDLPNEMVVSAELTEPLR